jgi:membrane protein implicated in regulation of membrane protease activity
MSAMYWLAVMVLFLVIEAATVSLVSIWFAIGSVAAAIAAYVGLNMTEQVLVFVLVSAVTVFIFKKFFHDKVKKKYQPTNADALIGKNAMVTESIDSISGSGTVEIEGKLWSAKSDVNIEKGTLVEVLKIEGVKLVVKEKAEVR